MKLTKGRISKILNKRKQTLKKHKNKRKTHVGKTFRKNTHINLYNSTLKNYTKGGEKNVTFGSPQVLEFERKEPVINISGTQDQYKPSIGSSLEVTPSPIEEQLVKNQDAFSTPIEIPEIAKDVPTLEGAVENLNEEKNEVIEDLSAIPMPQESNVVPQKEPPQEVNVDIPLKLIDDDEIENLSEEKEAAKIVNNALREFSGGKKKKRTKYMRLKKTLNRRTIKQK